MLMQIPLPIVIAKEDKWFVAICPILDVATQGKTEEEAKEMMADLINDYFRDPDTVKPKMTTIMSISLTNVPVNVPEGVMYGKAQTALAAKSY